MALIYCDRCSVYAQHRYDLFAVCWFAFLAMCVRSRVRLDTIVQKNKIKDYGSILAHCLQNRTGPGGRTVKTGNRDENRFFKPKEPDFLLIP